MVLVVLRVEHIVACKLGCKCKKKRGGKTGRQGDRERERTTEREEDTKHSCANRSQDENWLPLPRSKQELSRCLQVLHPQQKLAQLLDSLVSVSRLVERDQKKTRACELVHHKRSWEWPPLARTHAKHL